jgi:hypothetical protein
MKRVESMKRWAMRRKNPRFRATSVRVCSSAIKLFFESQIKVRQRPVDGGFADLRAAARDDLVGDLRQRQIRRFVDDGSDHVVAFDENRLPRTAHLLRVDDVRLDELPDDLYHRRMGDGETLPCRTAGHALNQDGMHESFAKVVRQRFHFVPHG